MGPQWPGDALPLALCDAAHATLARTRAPYMLDDTPAFTPDYIHGAPRAKIEF